MARRGGADGRPRVRWGVMGLLLLSVLLLLALLSYDPADALLFTGGSAVPGPPGNWIGSFGAYTARGLLLVLGFGAYLLTALSTAGAARRLFARSPGRPGGWEYWGAVFLATLGCSMLFGIWPDAGAGLSRALNLAQTPGGALGQRLCSPESGWMRLILNRTGSAIIAVAFLVGGLAVIWIYDWHDLFVTLLARRRENGTESEPRRKEADPEPDKPLEERKKKRAKRRREVPLSPPEPEPEPGPTASELPRVPVAATADSGPQRSRARRKVFRLPGPDLLDAVEGEETTADPAEVETKKNILQETLDSFDIDAKVIGSTSGPRVTLFEVLPAPGVKVERISQISNNIAMELQAISLRILTPIPGRKSVGIEVPNSSPATVTLRSLMGSSAWKNSKARIPLILGRNISGKVVVLDLAQAPHLLIAGATGSGKSVCINTLIMSMLFRFSPDELRMIMVDPKVVEFRAYHKLPHLVVPVVSDVKKVPLALRWVIGEMQRRYQWLAKVGARNIQGFNARPKSPEPVLDDDGDPIPDRLPYIIVIIDELADIIMTARNDVETSLARIAQLSRAVGIHAIIATQRPSVNVITGTIKANFPTRIAFQVTSQVDSRTILDGKGAEALLGRGDMLFRPPGASKLERNQGALVQDEEIERVVDFWASQAEQSFEESVFRAADAAGGAEAGGGQVPGADEELIQQAIEIIVRDRRPTTSYIQRCLRIGYNRAALIMEILEQRGIVGPQIGTAPREILIAGGSGGDAAEEEVAGPNPAPEDEPGSQT
ncbi:MAG: DNA translocase FtsK [Kiritimatiellaeota bacterium]|nr:DNA translocase FtsK [Kiritimatiellota bacterium]